MFKCFDFYFLVPHVAPGKVWACPLQKKFADIPRCLMLFHYPFYNETDAMRFGIEKFPIDIHIQTSRFNRYGQFRGIVRLAKHMRIRKSIHLGSWIMSVTLGSSNARIRLQPRPQGFSLREWERRESPGNEVYQILWHFSFDLSFPVKWEMGQRGRLRALALVYCEFHVIYGSWN